MKQWFWPDIDTIDEARKIARNGAAISFLISFATALITFLETQGYFKLFGFGPEAYLDAGLFLMIGTGIFFYSRIAALAGLCLYVFEQYHMMKSGATQVSFVAIYFTLIFLNALRAAFDYHHFKKQEKQEAAVPEGPSSILTGQPLEGQTTQETPASAAPKGFPTRLLLIGFGVIALGGALWFALPYIRPTRSAPNTSATGGSSAVPSGSRTFRMKSGDVIRGEVMMEDPDFFVIKSGGKEEVLARGDMESVE